ncbi:MAG: ribonuclease P protein component 1 [Candidatus Micrarchaeota archaeon]|nr:ribonuclease P protein component 1 [Candidatus Micrarchaeota archaeon]
MITPENLPIHELIGLKVRVANSLSTPHIGISGTVVDETKNTLVISDGKKERVVPKNGSTFQFSLPGGKRAELDGSKIAFRPYDRPKKLR